MTLFSAAICDWMISAALPVWSTSGWDEHASMFVERLMLDGAPDLVVPRRVMVQARQIFVYSVAQRRRWMPGSGELVELATHNMIQRYYMADGRPGWVFSVDRAGGVVDSRRDLYAHAFILLALAQAHEITGNRRLLALADETLAFLDAEMRSAYGGFVETLPLAGGPRRQNPHMHLFEALLALHETDPAAGYLARAAPLRQLFLRRFLQSEGRVLVEYFDDALNPLDGPIFPFEPGHHFEWIWLLSRYALLEGCENVSELAPLWDSAVRYGLNTHGQIVNQTTEAGIIDAGTRLWTYAEAAKAAHFVAKSGIDVGRHTAINFLDRLHKKFLVPATRGIWIDVYDAEGQCAVDFVPASSLYHICCAVDVLIENPAPSDQNRTR
jgi:mannose-6-phosphate isomerase